MDHFVHCGGDTRRVAHPLQFFLGGEIRLVLCGRHSLAGGFRCYVRVNLCLGDRGFPGLGKLLENEGVENFLARRRFRLRGDLVPVDLFGVEFNTLHSHCVSISVKLLFERRLHE